MYKFWRIFPGIFLDDFSGHFSFPTKMRRINPARKIREKSGGSKIKIREKSVLPKAGPNNTLLREYRRGRYRTQLPSMQAHSFGNPFACYTGRLWALRAQSRKKNPKMSPRGRESQGVQKGQNGVENESK